MIDNDEQIFKNVHLNYILPTPEDITTILSYNIDYLNSKGMHFVPNPWIQKMYWE